jgi:hypothetical protein
MKKKLIILVGLFMMFQFTYSLSCVRSYYIVVDGTLKYTGAGQNRVVKNVDIETFEDLDWAFAKDKNRVYYLGQNIKNIDAKTFEVIREYKPPTIILKSPKPTCGPPNIEKFKDKNGTYELKDIQNGKLQLEE